MKTDKLKNVLATMMLVVGLAGASSARAIDEDLDDSTASADLFMLHCPNTATFARANIQERPSLAGNDVIQLQILYTSNCRNNPIATRNAPSNGDPSTYATVNCAGGFYFVSISHTIDQNVNENYSTTIQCRNAMGNVAPLSLSIPPNPDD